MSAQQLNGMIEAAIGKIKEMVDSSTVIGEPIALSNGSTAVPVCKVTVGFGSGASSASSSGLSGPSGMDSSPSAISLRRRCVRRRNQCPHAFPIAGPRQQIRVAGAGLPRPPGKI